MMRKLLIVALAVIPAFAADTVASNEAKDHIGETTTVCGKVPDARYIDSSHVTFLNFDKAYPNHTFTAFLPAESRAKFGTPEKDYRDKDVCVTGKIQNYRGSLKLCSSIRGRSNYRRSERRFAPL